MRVVTTCSRAWIGADVIYAALSALPPGSTVIHGDCPEGDRSLVAPLAEMCGHHVIAMPADWSKGKGAGFARNVEMLGENPDLVLAFQLDGSRGTQHTIDEAEKRRIPVNIYRRFTPE